MMTRSYNGMLMHTNNSISIFICLYFDLNSMFYCAGLLERTYFTCLALYFFMDLSGMHVPLFHLPLLEDFQFIPLYSWGSYIFTCLYRHMCQDSLLKSKQVGGCLLLLHVK